MINKYAMASMVSQLTQLIPQQQVLLDEPMGLHTTFAIGGPADVLVLPHTVKEMSQTIRLARQLELPVTVIGGGSNVLVLDGGIRGVVIQLNEMNKYLSCHDTKILASSGFMLKDVCQFAQQNSLTGMEFACGIPGTLGGAVFMNAGAYGGEMSHIVSRVRTVNRNGSVHTYKTADFEFGYRKSIFQRLQEFVVEVELQLSRGDQTKIQEQMDDLMERRRSKQPLEMHSAGSTFKRPPGYYAGTLIDQTGLKGLSCGDAQVSTKHAGFVVNTGHATARDVLAVIHEVQKRVEAAHGVHLEPEVRILGEEQN
ncbi:MAG: UDP-N-acetylmuramate dehydrogenase [Caecibacter massiliensis]|nr:MULTISPECIES: UDP-N-acetylmuramate dehydrogenase [Megasphaera]MCI5531972.1 UDP-N-acetylmuramate dehydrogenase [Caecibacter massiliensis]